MKSTAIIKALGVSPAGKSLIHPLLEPFEHNLGLNSPIKTLFKPTLGPTSALRNKSALGNWTIGLHFTHPNGPIFRSKTDLSDLKCYIPSSQYLPAKPCSH